MKFGGTSVGSPQRMKEVARIFEPKDGDQSFVVLSAMSGTTNSLVEIADYLYKQNPEGASTIINQLEQKYLSHIDELYATEEYREKTLAFLQEEFRFLRSFTKDAPTFSTVEEKIILAQGEIISTNMVTNYLQEQGKKAMLLSALDLIRTDENGEPDLNFIREATVSNLKQNPGFDIYITQGFICRNHQGEIDNLQRGGSDYTACLIGAALQTDEIQIWTDIDGMHNRFDSYTSRKLPNWPISVQRYCIRPASSRQSSPAYPSACSTPWTQRLQALSSTTRFNGAPSRPSPQRTTSLAYRFSLPACCWHTDSCARCLRYLNSIAPASI